MKCKSFATRFSGVFKVRGGGTRGPTLISNSIMINYVILNDKKNYVQDDLLSVQHSLYQKH